MLFPLPKNIQQFIQNHLNDDTTQLLLKAKSFPDIPMREAVQQILARQKAKTKLPSWFENQEIVFPSALSLEQCSSEITAHFKSSLISGKLLIDLTGGMGVDITVMSGSVERAIYVERNEELAHITQHNLSQLGKQNIDFFQEDSLSFLEKFEGIADWIYIDPHRRDANQQRVVGLQDCEPNVLEIKDLLFKKAKNILIKASPLLDIDKAIYELGEVETVYVVAVDNEVKEVLIAPQPPKGERAAPTHSPTIIAINITTKRVLNMAAKDWAEATNSPFGGGGGFFSFSKQSEKNAPIRLSEPLKYIYEPNVAILKAGAFKSVAQQYDLFKLHAHSHLYTSAEIRADFLGRIFELEAVCKLDKKQILAYLPDKKANITTRNFPLSVKEIRQKIGVQEGGNVYLLATTDWKNQKVILVCKKAIL